MASGFGAVGLGATLAGGILQGFGAAKQGDAAQSMYNYRAQVARINADINRQNADWARTRGEKEAVQYGMKAAYQAGKIKVAQAASGLDVNTGTAAAVRDSQSKIVNMDLATIRENAARIAYDYDRKAVMDENQARLDEMAGRQAKEASKLKIMESIIGTVSGVSSKWQQGKVAGLWGSSGNSGSLSQELYHAQG